MKSAFVASAASFRRPEPNPVVRIILGSLLLLLSAATSAVGFLPVGPFGGTPVFVPDPRIAEQGYASVGHVLYRTGDAGAHWSIVHRFDPAAAITAIAPDPFAAGTVFVTAGNAAWKSTDSGATFAAITPPGVSLGLGIVASAAQAGLVYAYQRLGVFRSDDRGATWTATSTNDVATFFGYRLAAHPAEPGTLFLSNPSLVARSTDAGHSWTTVIDVATAAFPAVRIAKSDPRRIVAALGANGIAISDDTGATFRIAATPAAFSGLEIDPLDANRWRAVAQVDAADGAPRGTVTLWETVDAGATWSAGTSFARGARSDPPALIADPASDAFYIAGAADLLRIGDGGTTVVAANNGLRTIADLPVESGTTLFAATAFGVRKSDDAGERWSVLDAPVAGVMTRVGVPYNLGAARSVVLDNSPYYPTRLGDPQMIHALDWQQSVIISTDDSGASWHAVPNVPTGAIAYPGAIAADPSNPGLFDAVLVIQAGGTFGSTGARVVRSTGGFGSPLQALATPSCAPTEGIVYRIARGTPPLQRLLLGRPCGLAYTDDTGITWNTVGTPAVLAFARDPSTAGRWLAGTASGLYRSLDDGATWSLYALNGMRIASVAFDPESPLHVVAVIDGSVWSSPDGGRAWIRLDDGIAAVNASGGVTGVKFAQGVLFATTNEGLYRCADRACSAGSPVRTTKIVEFRNALLDHYFIAEEGDETAAIERGSAGPGWSRTGQSFDGFSFAGALPADAGSVCRFYGTPGIGPNSHFYTIFPEECDAVARDSGWSLESRSLFVTGLPETACKVSGCTSSCGAGRAPVRRLYNNRAAFNDSNHRYTTDPSIYAAMQASGWVGEGIVFCSP